MGTSHSLTRLPRDLQPRTTAEESFLGTRHAAFAKPRSTMGVSSRTSLSSLRHACFVSGSISSLHSGAVPHILTPSPLEAKSKNYLQVHGNSQRGVHCGHPLRGNLPDPFLQAILEIARTCSQSTTESFANPTSLAESSTCVG